MHWKIKIHQMQDEINNLSDSVPGLSSLPVLGNLFRNRNNTSQKTELVIFLHPLVIKEASIAGDYSGFRDSLPDGSFFKQADGNP